MKRLKPDEKVILNLQLSVKEVRLLRNEIYCVLGDLDDENNPERIGDDQYPAFGKSLEEWMVYKSSLRYNKVLGPLVEKLYVALRLSLGQGSEVPPLHGLYTQRFMDDGTPQRDIFHQWITAVLEDYNNLRIGSNDKNNEFRLLSRLGETLGIYTKRQGSTIIFGVTDEDQERDPQYLLGIKWTSNQQELIQTLMKGYDAHQKWAESRRRRKRKLPPEDIQQ